MSLLFSSARRVEEAREVSSPLARPSRATWCTGAGCACAPTPGLRFLLAVGERATSLCRVEPGPMGQPWVWWEGGGGPGCGGRVEVALGGVGGLWRWPWVVLEG